MIDLTLGNVTLAVADDEAEEYGFEYEYDAAAGPALASAAAAMTAELQNVSGGEFVKSENGSNILALLIYR